MKTPAGRPLSTSSRVGLAGGGGLGTLSSSLSNTTFKQNGTDVGLTALWFQDARLEPKFTSWDLRYAFGTPNLYHVPSSLDCWGVNVPLGRNANVFPSLFSLDPPGFRLRIPRTDSRTKSFQSISQHSHTINLIRFRLSFHLDL